jgi:hypothetical protein
MRFDNAIGPVVCAGSALASDPQPRVKLTTSQGDIVVELNRVAAPKTVDNFLAYVNDGFYDGTIFHRVIAGFMIQGGGFDAQMNRKPTRPPIPNEADNRLPNLTGTIAMARTADAPFGQRPVLHQCQKTTTFWITGEKQPRDGAIVYSAKWCPE